jgi:excisionase family DNA binding protein
VTAAAKAARDLVPLTEVPAHRPWAKVRWLRRLVAEHRIPFYKVAGKVLLDLNELDAFAERGRVDAVS